MTVYVVVPLGTRRDILKSAVDTLPKEDVFELVNNSGWLINFRGLPEELSKKLGLSSGGASEGNKPNFLVVSVDSYYGFGPRDMWNWIANHKGS